MVYQDLDEAQVAPEGRRSELQATFDAARAEGRDPVDPNAEVPCTPYTGQRPDGSCVRLRVEKVPFGERILLPAGAVILGEIPDSYAASMAPDGTPVIRYKTQPLRRAAVDSYWMDVVEVQRRAYEDCVAHGDCTPAACLNDVDPLPQNFSDPVVAGRLPQTCISYAQAQGYCSYAGGRLPTYAEWIYAARGPELNAFSWGPDYRDEMIVGLVPVSSMNDRSYFGVVGLGTGAIELVSETPEFDEALAPFLREPFRSERGPYAKRLKAWRNAFVCEGLKAAECEAKERAARHAAASIRIGQKLWVWDGPPSDATLEFGPNGEKPAYLPDPLIGFRCAYDRKAEDPLLALPAAAPQPPEYLTRQGMDLFVGAAEAVSHGEAEVFCTNIELAAERLADLPQASWRLPTYEELERVEVLRLGPGPLWLADGTAVKAELAPDGTVIRWERVEMPTGAGILARCVRE